MSSLLESGAPEAEESYAIPCFLLLRHIVVALCLKRPMIDDVVNIHTLLSRPFALSTDWSFAGTPNLSVAGS